MAEPNWFAENAPDTTTADWFAMQDTAKAAAPADVLQSRRPKGPTEPLAKWALDALPTLGGLGGGTLGGIGGSIAGLGVGGWPGAVGGAAVGGAGGEALRQLGYNALGYGGPESPEDALRRIATEGSIQGASEGGGRLVAGAVGHMAEPLMRKALRPSAATLREFPDVVKTALRSDLPVGKLPGGELGSDMAAVKLRGSAKRTRRMLERADRAGVRFDPAEFMPDIYDLWASIKKQPLSDADHAAVDRMAQEFFANRPGPINATALKDLKRYAQNQAQTVFKAQRAGNVVNANQGIEARFNKKIATKSKSLLESRIPGIARSEAKTQSLIGAQRAIKSAELKPMTMNIPYLPKAATEFAAPGMAEILSRLGIAADDPRVLFALGQLPRTAGALFPRPYPAAPDTTR